MSATSERWQPGAGFVLTGMAATDWRRLEDGASTFFEITDTGTAGDLYTLRHRLRRIPRGCVIVRQQVPSGTADAVRWYNEDRDPVWDESEMQIRFTISNARVLLEVF